MAEFARRSPKTTRVPETAAAPARAQAEPEAARPAGLQWLQRLGPVFPLNAGSPSAQVVQRAVYKEKGKNAVTVTAQARKIARWVKNRPSILPPSGRSHVADVHARGLAGYKWGNSEYVGGRVFNNNAQPDGARLPNKNSETYQEWDVNPSVAGVARDAERIVTSSTGETYYTNDHYANFTELK